MLNPFILKVADAVPATLATLPATWCVVCTHPQQKEKGPDPTTSFQMQRRFLLGF